MVLKRPSEVTDVATSLIDDIWPKIVPHLEKGREYWEDYYELEDILDFLKAGRMQLWVGVSNKEIHIVMLTCINVFPKAKFLHLIYAGGSRLRDVMYYYNNVAKWARSHGIVGMQSLSRPGMVRLLEKDGFVPKAVYLVKMFNERLN